MFITFTPPKTNGWIPKIAIFERRYILKTHHFWYLCRISEGVGSLPTSTFTSFSDEFKKMYPGIPTSPPSPPSPHVNPWEILFNGIAMKGFASLSLLMIFELWSFTVRLVLYLTRYHKLCCLFSSHMAAVSFGRFLNHQQIWPLKTRWLPTFPGGSGIIPPATIYRHKKGPCFKRLVLIHQADI